MSAARPRRYCCPNHKIVDHETHEFERSYFGGSPRRAYSEELDAEMVIHRRNVGETVNRLVDAGFTVEEIREPGYEDPTTTSPRSGAWNRNS